MKVVEIITQIPMSQDKGPVVINPERVTSLRPIGKEATRITLSSTEFYDIEKNLNDTKKLLGWSTSPPRKLRGPRP